jgi:hypothetical protein
MAASGASEAFGWLVALGVVAEGVTQSSDPEMTVLDSRRLDVGWERLGRLSSMPPRLPGLFPSGRAVAARGSIPAGGSILPGAAIVMLGQRDEPYRDEIGVPASLIESG